VRDMAEIFLAHYARSQAAKPDEPGFGDIQSFKSVGLEDRDKIAEEFRIELPSRAVAKVWEKEGE